MSIDIQKELDRLSQRDFVNRITRILRPSEMLTVQLDKCDTPWGESIYSVLIPNTQVEESLADEAWDIHRGDGLPGTVSYVENELHKVDYLRYGTDDGTEPLVFYRGFHGVRPSYYELSEEFRHFHDLYHDVQENRYLKFGESGEENVIATITGDCVRVRLLELRRFLAIKEMHLAILFDCGVRSQFTIKELGLSVEHSQHRDKLLSWSLAFGDDVPLGDERAFSRLLGKYLIAPLPKEKSGFWDFAEPKELDYVSYLVDVDDAGEPILASSNPDTLNNYFGSNPDGHQYLTPVHFRRQVLDKYYQEADKYTVEGKLLRCYSLWVISIDMDLEDRVVVWLGDLGRDLPYAEQLHFKQYNIAPDGDISESYFKNQILNQVVSPKSPEFRFRKAYGDLARVCDEHLGWSLLKPLRSEDEHNYKSIRIPATDEQREFDALVQSLTKLLIDSLNEKQLQSLLEPAQTTLTGGINKLEAVLKSRLAPGYSQHIQFLRNLQELRSKGSAHRKGKEYQKAYGKFASQGQGRRSVCAEIIRVATETLDYFSKLVADEVLSGTK